MAKRIANSLALHPDLGLRQFGGEVSAAQNKARGFGRFVVGEHVTKDTQERVLLVQTVVNGRAVTILGVGEDGSVYPAGGAWAASTVYPLHKCIVPTAANGHRYLVTTPGTSGAAEPAWPTTNGATVVDGTVTFTEAGDDFDTKKWNPQELK